VNEALDVAVAQLSWSNSRNTLKILFLVGDAPPHMNYAQDRKYPAIIADARRRGIIVNTVQAGGARDTERVWREIAQLADGDYLRIPQSGGVVVIETPFDRDIHDLQIELNKTVVPYGRPAAQRVINEKLARTEAAPAPAASDMAAYLSKKRGDREIVTGGGDLVTDALAGRVRIDAVPESELPDALKTLNSTERRAFVEKQSQARNALDGRMRALVKQREAYIAAARAKQPNARDSFDRVVEETLRGQMRRAVTN
jgi:hypothetical protein